jgi:UDP-N-acetylmuramoyl-tripeptide--D-alanyl-D-alanine ligase
MITLITQIVLIIALILYVGVALKYELQMMQQNSYRNKRYWNWMMKNGDSSSPRRLTLYFLLLISCTRFTPEIIHPFIAVILVVLAVRELRMKYKKPVVFTQRATRLYIASWVVVLLHTTLWTALTQFDLSVVPILLLSAAAFSWVVILLANLLMHPIEMHINRGFYNEAKKILEAMPNLRIIGVTGSYGKTSTKHYLYRILSEKYNVLMTPGSYNTPMGVIRTVREMMKPYYDVFIVEMGAKQLGDIKEICDLVCPTIGIVTAVGEQHLESFKSIENVQRTKFELVDALPADGLAVVNNDFEYIANRTVNNVPVKRYALAPGTDYHVEDVEYGEVETRFAVVGEGRRIELATKLVGDCNLSNLMASVIVALHLDVPEKSIRYGVSQIEQVEHRLNMKRTPGGLSIIDDAFNSNPDGARMALDVLSRIKTGKRIVITPGMIELGDKQVEYNKRLGVQMASAADYVMVVGTYNRDAILSGLAEGGMPEEKIFVADSFVMAQARLVQIARAGDVVLYENDLPDTFK